MSKPPLYRRIFNLFRPVQEQFDRAELARAYRDTFSTPQGQLVLKHLITTCGVLQPTYVRGDSHDTAHNEGRRDVAVGILRMLNTDPEALADMMEMEEDNG